MIKILFVCHGNICRSTMAEFVMKNLVKECNMQDDVMIQSAATSREEIGNDTHYGTKRKLEEMNIPYTKHSARQICMNDYDEFDYLIGMDDANIKNMKRVFGGDVQHKIYTLLDFSENPRAIADPWYTGNFDITYDDVLEGCKALWSFINEHSVK